MPPFSNHLSYSAWETLAKPTLSLQHATGVPQSNPPQKFNQYIDIEYRTTGVLIRRPSSNTLDRSPHLARKVSRAARAKSPVRIQTSANTYDAYPLATGSTHSAPRGILKSRKINKSVFECVEASAESFKSNSWTEHCDRRIRFEWPVSSNEGTLHEFPASLAQLEGKGYSPSLDRGTNSSLRSGPSSERVCQDSEREDGLKKSSWPKDLGRWEPTERLGGSPAGLEDGKHRQEVKGGCVENIGLEEAEKSNSVAAAPGKKVLVAKGSGRSHHHARAGYRNEAGVSDSVHRRRIARGTRAELTRMDKHLTEERKALWGQ